MVPHPERNHLCPDALAAAARAGLRVAFNPAPITPAVRDYPLEHVDLLVVNETEAAALSAATEPAAALVALRRRFPRADIIVTLGSRGALAGGPSGEHRVAAPRVQAVDTTAAGDTFIGYLLASLSGGDPLPAALARAVRAAALSVTRPGAAASIPTRAEVDAFATA